MMLRKEMQQVLETSLPPIEQQTQNGDKQLDPEKFMKEVFDDRMELESWVSTSQNTHFVNKALAEGKPKYTAVAELVERFCPAWF